MQARVKAWRYACSANTGSIERALSSIGRNSFKTCVASLRVRTPNFGALMLNSPGLEAAISNFEKVGEIGEGGSYLLNLAQALGAQVA